MENVSYKDSLSRLASEDWAAPVLNMSTVLVRKMSGTSCLLLEYRANVGVSVLVQPILAVKA